MQVMALFLLSSVLWSDTVTPKAIAYEQTFRRYFSGVQLLRQLDHAFPENTKPTDPCHLIDKNTEILGLDIPLTGTSISKKPSPAFIAWYTPCLYKRLEQSMTQNREYYFPTKLFIPIGPIVPQSKMWMDIPETIRQALIQHWVHTLIGPSIIKNEAAVIQNYLKKTTYGPNSRVVTREVAYFILQSIALRDEFMTY